jgi:hypothetical protein
MHGAPYNSEKNINNLDEDCAQSVLKFYILIVGCESADFLENIQRLHHSLIPELYMEHSLVLLLKVELSEIVMVLSRIQFTSENFRMRT